MKTSLLSLFASLALSAAALAHGAIELGPAGGRLVEFGGQPPLHAEFVLKDGRFVVSLIDKATGQPIPVSGQQLLVTHRETKTKLAPELKDGKWSFAKPEGADFWLIVQIRESADARARNGRLHYDAGICPACKAQEWLCTCAGPETKTP